MYAQNFKYMCPSPIASTAYIMCVSNLFHKNKNKTETMATLEFVHINTNIKYINEYMN